MRRCLVQVIISNAHVPIGVVGIDVVIDRTNLRRKLGRPLARLFNESANVLGVLRMDFPLPSGRQYSSSVRVLEHSQIHSCVDDHDVLWVPMLDCMSSGWHLSSL